MAGWGGEALFPVILALLAVLPVPGQCQSCPEYQMTLCSETPHLTVAYNGEKFKCGSIHSEDETIDTPTVDFPWGEEGAKYLLVMTDPDAPYPCSPGSFRGKSFLHYLVTMIYEEGSLKVRKTLKTYFAPSPPMGTHRYQFRLFKVKKDAPAHLALPPRFSFRLSKLMEELKLGQPVAQFQFEVRAQK